MPPKRPTTKESPQPNKSQKSVPSLIQKEAPVEVIVEAKNSKQSQQKQHLTPSEPPPDIIVENQAPQLSNESQRRESIYPPKLNKTRLVMINYHQTEKYKSNHVTTAKYNLWSFLPFFLFEQFRRYSNIFFLSISLLQQIPDVSPTGRWSTLFPFLVILSVSAVKEIVEDVHRHLGDKSTNNREVKVLVHKEFQSAKWCKVNVGEFVKIMNDQFFPADIIVLGTSEPLGVCYIETSNLDGETNLKVRQAQGQTIVMEDPEHYANARGFIECEIPNRQLYEFSGSLKLESEVNVVPLPLGPDQLLLRGAQLRNTKWIIGIVLYTGFDTKLMKNSTKPPLKRSTMDKETNYQILMLFVFLIGIALTSAAFSQFIVDQTAIIEYVGGTGAKNDSGVVPTFCYSFLTFIILFNNVIPISLTVTLEVVRFIQALFINWDQDMYHLESDTHAIARTSNLNEELGQIRYIFSDKTGTLTRNVMEFKGCSVGGVFYDPKYLVPLEGSNEVSPLVQNLVKDKSGKIRDFLVLLAVCHNVISEMKISEDGSQTLEYNAASPDEKALVMGAKQFGFKFLTRTPQHVEISALEKIQQFQILSLIEFTSTRKRMTVIVRCPSGEIRLLCKGADSVIYERLSMGSEASELYTTTQSHLQQFATSGLRTLCCAYKVLSEKEFTDWNTSFQIAATSIHNREEAINDVAELIEKDLILLGATAIEDKLQEFVPETIAAFLEAGIRVWVLTGDKQETAVNIGYSCRLLTESMRLLVLNQETEQNTSECIDAYAEELSISLKSFKTKTDLQKIVIQDAAVIIDGNTLTFALMDKLRSNFVSLCCNCKAVIVCRASPIQKAEIVESVTDLTGAVTLAIGDGANDVAMIQKAHVGVGISGNEGLQAAGASDYAIAQFYFLKKLLFVHGAWSHNRITKTVFYSFYKNICLHIIELWFAIYSAWSGQVIFERWTIASYNVFFTCLQPIVIGLFDRNCSMKLRLENPILYHSSSNAFNLKQFFKWILNALVHSIFIFWITQLFVDTGILWGSGQEGGYLILGNFVYTYVVVVVSLKTGLETSAWTSFTHLAIWGSILLWIIFLFVYSLSYNFSYIGAEIHGVAGQVFTAPVFWLGLFIIPITTLLPDIMFKAVQGTYFRTALDDFRDGEIRNSGKEQTALDTPTTNPVIEEPTIPVIEEPAIPVNTKTNTPLDLLAKPSSKISTVIKIKSIRKPTPRQHPRPSALDNKKENETSKANPVIKYIPQTKRISRSSLAPTFNLLPVNDINTTEKDEPQLARRISSSPLEPLDQTEKPKNEVAHDQYPDLISPTKDEPASHVTNQSADGPTRLFSICGPSPS